ncbi:hypothetical protein L195_g058238, partial [Trifolium pratense]
DVFLLGTEVAAHSDWFTNQGVTKRIDNESLTFVWFDPLINGVPLRIRYQTLFEASHQRLDNLVIWVAE